MGDLKSENADGQSLNVADSAVLKMAIRARRNALASGRRPEHFLRGVFVMETDFVQQMLINADKSESFGRAERASPVHVGLGIPGEVDYRRGWSPMLQEHRHRN